MDKILEIEGYNPVEFVFTTFGGAQYHRGYHEYCGGVQYCGGTHITKDYSTHGTEHPTALKISPQHTEHPQRTHDILPRY